MLSVFQALVEVFTYQPTDNFVNASCDSCFTNAGEPADLPKAVAVLQVHSEQQPVIVTEQTGSASQPFDIASQRLSFVEPLFRNFTWNSQHDYLVLGLRSYSYCSIKQATASISINAPFGNSRTPTTARAG